MGLNPLELPKWELQTWRKQSPERSQSVNILIAYKLGAKCSLRSVNVFIEELTITR